MKIGDRVRFLSDIGGGKVAGFKGNNIVLVEDEDGFQIPTPINDVVLIDDDDYRTSRIVNNKLGSASRKSKSVSSLTDSRSIKAKMKDGIDNAVSMNDEDYDLSEKEITFRKPAEERKGGNLLSAYLAFVPIDILEVTNTRFELYFINDSNYYIHYTYLAADGSNWTMRSHGEVMPNTKLFIEEFGRDALNDLGHVAIQMMAYKYNQAYIIKPLIDVQFRIDPVKFYKLHTFQSNDFFEIPALLYTIVENDNITRPLVVDPKKLKAEMYKQADHTDSHSQTSNNQTFNHRYADRNHKENPFMARRRGGEDVVVVDLHAGDILDSTAGMEPGDILNYQLKVFRETLADYGSTKGQKIVFIHGKGEGVLRRAIINELSYRYKSYTYQDASFQEYGYGATQVTIK